MKRRVEDPRLPECTDEVVVFSYSREEKETTLNFKYDEGKWYIWTSVPTHITRLLKLNNGDIKVDSVSDTGYITSVKGTLAKNQVSFRNGKINFMDCEDLITQDSF